MLLNINNFNVFHIFYIAMNRVMFLFVFSLVYIVFLSGQVTIIRNPQIEIRVLQECRGHQTGNIFAVHGGISLNGPKVHVLSGGVDVSTQARDERLHRPHQQHVFDEEQIEFRR